MNEYINWTKTVAAIASALSDIFCLLLIKLRLI